MPTRLFEVIPPAEGKEPAISLRVALSAGAGRAEVAGQRDGALTVKVAPPPKSVAANEEVRRAVAQLFDVPVDSVTVTSGESSSQKQLLVAGVSEHLAERTVSAAARNQGANSKMRGQKGR